MARPDRLFRLLHALRTLPKPVTAAQLAEATGVSERTLYRDIAGLRAAGALIDGAAGVGYSLTEDPALPPQMFDRLEVEALVLGLAEVRLVGDPALARAAESAQAKIIATLPERVQRHAVHAVQQTYRFEPRRPAPPPTWAWCAKPAGRNARWTWCTRTRPGCSHSAASGRCRSCFWIGR
ncbi:MAG: HTH domain-containing protein [Marinagarivorans sp.]|nr:HTH domain-containing protein [Marinagarivorans sp.]